MAKKNMKENLQSFAVKQVLHYLDEDPEKSLPKLLDWADKFDKDNTLPSQRRVFHKILENPDNNWYTLIMSLWTDLDPEVRKTFFENFLVNTSLIGYGRQEKAAAEHNCNIPWAILMDPTSACNLHCTGCWAAEYGNKLNMSLETMDNIIQQGKELGTFMYIFSGGEPMVRKDDIIRLCELHPDCMFLAFTNGTLIDDKFAQEMLRVKNFVPAISVEGFEEATDSRRGQGTYQAVMKAMQVLKEHKLPFGISCCYTTQHHDYLIAPEVLPLHACGQRCRARAAAHPRTAGEDGGAHPGLPGDQAHLRFGLPKRRRVCQGLHCRRPALPAHQRQRRHGALRVHPLLRLQRVRQDLAGGPEIPPVHGLPRRLALQRQHAAPLSHAGKPGKAPGHGEEVRRQVHRYAVPRGRGQLVRQVQALRRQVDLHRRPPVELLPQLRQLPELPQRRAEITPSSIYIYVSVHRTKAVAGWQRPWFFVGEAFRTCPNEPTSTTPAPYGILDKSPGRVLPPVGLSSIFYCF